MKDTKDSELLHFSSLNFVIFATFVVNVLFLFWLRLRRIRRFVVRGTFAFNSAAYNQCTRFPHTTKTLTGRKLIP